MDIYMNEKENESIIKNLIGAKIISVEFLGCIEEMEIKLDNGKTVSISSNFEDMYINIKEEN